MKNNRNEIENIVNLVNGIILCRKMAKKNVVFPTYFFVSQIHADIRTEFVEHMKIKGLEEKKYAPRKGKIGKISKFCQFLCKWA